MSFTAAVLIIVSAFMHAGWNYVSKRSSPSLAFFWIAAVSGAMVTSPLLVVHRRVLGVISAETWLLILLTGIAQAIYMSGLAGAYKRGDISLAYPLARALPVLFIAAISLLLGNGNDIARISLIGMILIIAGCIILPLRNFRQTRLRDYFGSVYLMAFIAALGTTGYTMLDDQALRLLRSNPHVLLSTTNTTLLFIAFQVGSTAIMLGIVTLLYRPERELLQRMLKNRSLVLTGLLTGVVIMATYGLALAAMAYVTNVSYVAAFRQLSIPIGAMMGLILQGEARYRPKLIGIAIVSIGLILVGLG